MARGISHQDHNYPPPTVFIGCSSAALEYARIIRAKIEVGGQIDCRVWDNLFHPGSNVLDNLLRYVNLFDFAVLVLSADDLTSTRGKKRTASPPPCCTDRPVGVGSWAV